MKKQQEKLINLMLRHSEVIEELCTQNITPDYFDERYQPLVQAIYYVHGISDGKRLLTDDHYRELLLKQGCKGDITIAMQVWHDCTYGVHHSNSKNDLDMLVEQLTEHYVHRQGVEALALMNEDVARHGYLEATRRYVERLQETIEVAAPTSNIVPVPLGEIASQDSQREWIWYGMIAKRCVTLLAGKRKGGKSTLLAELLRHSARGGQLIGEILPTKVLYVTEENRDDWQARIEDHELSGDNVDALFILEHPELINPTWDKYTGFMRRIGQLVDERGYDLVVFDTISKLVPLEDERDAIGWHRVYKGVWSITSKNVGVLLVHHCRKTEGSDPLDIVRGSGVICDNAHNIMVLGLSKLGRDTERTLDVWGRFDSPTKFALDYNEEANQYFAVNASELRKENELVQALDRMLMSIGQMNSNEIVNQLSGTSSRASIMRMLRKGTELGYWCRTGKGTEGEPHAYQKEQETELQDIETNKREKICI